MARLTVNGVRRMIGGNSLDDKKWVFRSSPGCCAKCDAYNGKVVHSRTKPTWGPHWEYGDHKANCKCIGWVLASD